MTLEELEGDMLELYERRVIAEGVMRAYSALVRGHRCLFAAVASAGV
jgi:hypothetical protein